MMAATAWSTVSVVSRAWLSRAVKPASKSGEAVERRIICGVPLRLKGRAQDRARGPRVTAFAAEVNRRRWLITNKAGTRRGRGN